MIVLKRLLSKDLVPVVKYKNALNIHLNSGKLLNHSKTINNNYKNDLIKRSIFQQNFYSTNNENYSILNIKETENIPPKPESKYDYDLIVIGGGSGGLSCAQEAGLLKQKVLLLDYVRTSVRNTTWGLGGTCVNVGCIPKKLFHEAALAKDHISTASFFGWNVDSSNYKHDWNKFVKNVQGYIKSLNWGYRVKLRETNVKYVNAQAKFIDSHTIECIDAKGLKTQYSANRFVIAVGGRPKYLDIPGSKEYAISSDDLFSLSTPPGKTLIIGASYIALECAGFLTQIGYNTTVMSRSIFLRGFDQQMANLTVDHMENNGTNFLRNSTPIKIEKIVNESSSNGDSTGSKPFKLRVTYRVKEQDQKEVIKFEDYDTVMMAVGRTPETHLLNLESTGVNYNKNTNTNTNSVNPTNPNSDNLKIPVNSISQTNVSHIYAIGDVIEQMELTPSAIKAGKLLSQRLFSDSKDIQSYENIPTTVFTPLEYSCVGISEEEAIKRYGKDGIEVYHSFYTPLSWSISDKHDECYVKMICIRNDKDKDKEKVIALHILGQNSGEILQGFSVAIKMGATKADFNRTLGIHPTDAEEVIQLRITKRSGDDPKKTGC